MNKIIKFSAAWCGPCKAMAPQFKKFQEAHKEDSVEIVDVDVDQNYELASEYGVRSIPYTVFIKEGEVVNRLTGIANFDKLNDMYDEVYAVPATA
jgi:thioredoxin 1